MAQPRLISLLTTLTLAALTSACGGMLPGNRSSGLTPTAPIHAPIARLGEGTLKTLAVSPDGALVAFATSLGIALYDLRRLQPVRMLTAAGVDRVTFSPDGRLVAAGVFVGRTTGRDERGGVQMETSRVGMAIRIWRVADGAELRTFDAHQSFIHGLAFSPDGQLLASGAHDDSVKLWRVSDGSLRFSVDHPRVFDVAFSPDGQLLAAAGNEPFIPLWRVNDGALAGRLAGGQRGFMGLAFAPDGQTLAAGSFDQQVYLWRLSDGARLRTLTGHSAYLTAVAFLPDGRTLVSGSFDRTIRLWRPDDGALLRAMEGHTHSVTAVAFAPDGATLLSASLDQTARR